MKLRGYGEDRLVAELTRKLVHAPTCASDPATIAR